MVLQQMAAGQDRGLIGDSIAIQLNAGKVLQVEQLDQGLLHRQVVERTPRL